MLLHNIKEADVQLADHLYRWEKFRLKSGIALRLHEDPSKISVFTLNEFDNFCVVTLCRFKKKSQLRRVAYDQGDSYLHWMKVYGTSFVENKLPAEQIIRNTRFLLDIANRNPFQVKEVLGEDLNDFAQLCCTKTSEFWLEKFPNNGATVVVAEPGKFQPTLATSTSMGD
jgi:DNA-binding ferritin-like protein (Dps family)